MFKMIRVGTGFEIVIMVSPPEAAAKRTPDAKYYRYASWQIYDDEPDVFNEIHPDRATSYFMGIADGIGYEPPPEDIFPSIEAATEFVDKKRSEYARKRLEEMGITPLENDEEVRQQFREEAMRAIENSGIPVEYVD